MAGVQVEAGSALAQTIQSAAQAKLMEAGWAAEENDTTLSEYVTMMLVNGKDFHGVQSELGGELLGVGEDDPGVADFTTWLFEHAQSLAGPSAPTQQERDAGATTVEPQMQEDDAQQIPSFQDEQMGDAAPAADGVPSGPKAMRNGSDASRGRGRGGRLLGQVNRNMDRSQDDPLRRIKGAASGSAGRIDAHAGRAPRGPRGGNVANGVQRMMNGGRGGHPGAVMGQMNPMMPQTGGPGQLDPSTQMQFMQMMEMQASMMANMIQQNGGQMPNMGGGPAGFQPKGRGGKSLFDRMDNKRGGSNFKSRQQSHTDGASSSGMDIDKPLTDITDKKPPPFDTMCKFNAKCLNPDCPFAHQSPANTRPGLDIDTTDTCTFGAACQNIKCLARHPSPAARHAHNTHPFANHNSNGKAAVDCKFYPNCSAGPACPFRHPDTRPCRNGADCKVEACPFAHSSIACRYNPCTRAECPYKHAEGQRRGKFEDKVWTAMEGGEPMDEAGGGGKTDRFAELKASEGEAEELILPGQQQQQQQQHGDEGQQGSQQQQQLFPETQIAT
ncbi:hypothetical protein LTR36_008726 [Oleoguttula mirabilis]|uniref:C3H1-type domain-containing protein n=1 Tax=Oleoguttula mirabilis TaxID=1507867 RepID=A0AAV9JTD6_9PEZI|nr:hypothetical protein LTR36_008726 [Oleoguttula mirabilis]